MAGPELAEGRRPYEIAAERRIPPEIENRGTERSEILIQNRKSDQASASGLIGDPVPPMIFSGAATKTNS